MSVCENCNSYFLPTVNRNQSYCEECRIKTAICPVCGNTFKSPRVHSRIYCSPICAKARFNKNK